MKVYSPRVLRKGPGKDGSGKTIFLMRGYFRKFSKGPVLRWRVPRKHEVIAAQSQSGLVGSAILFKGANWDTPLLSRHRAWELWPSVARDLPCARRIQRGGADCRLP